MYNVQWRRGGVDTLRSASIVGVEGTHEVAVHTKLQWENKLSHAANY